VWALKHTVPEPQPSTSGLNNKGGPIELSSEDSQLFSDVELTDDEDVCCVCNKWQPIELKDVEGVVFVKWINKLINCQNKFKFN
jgi:hypothetical protein